MEAYTDFGRIFLLSTSSRPIWGSPNPLSNEYWVLLLSGIKRKGHESDHSPPTSAEIKNMWIYTSPPPYVFME
jgi:hypothetical protein